jgi:hypothetical protein
MGFGKTGELNRGSSQPVGPRVNEDVVSGMNASKQVQGLIRR